MNDSSSDGNNKNPTEDQTEDMKLSKERILISQAFMQPSIDTDSYMTLTQLTYETRISTHITKHGGKLKPLSVYDSKQTNYPFNVPFSLFLLSFLTFFFETLLSVRLLAFMHIHYF